MAKTKTSKKTNAYKEKAILLGIAVVVALLLHFFPSLRMTLSKIFPFMEAPREVTPVTGDLDVHFIDVGQGDATLIMTPEGKAMLIDTGEASAKDDLIAYIQSTGVSTIEYLVLTHPHSDHIGGATAILNAFTVNHVMMSDAETDTFTFLRLLEAIDSKNIDVILPKAEDTYPLGGANITCLGPLQTYSSLNEMSLVLRLDYGKTAFLFTGDAEKRAEEDMLQRYSLSEFRADVLKIGHHGSSSSTSESFLAAVAPSYGIILCGDQNDYGHPHKETLHTLENANVTLLRTDRDGTIVLTSNGDKVTLLLPSTHSEATPKP